METRRLDVEDDAQCARAREILTAATGFERPWYRPPSLAESVVEWRHEDPAEPMEMWAAVDAGETLGMLMLWLPTKDNVAKVWFVVRVDPAARRRGAGRALVERLVMRARETGRCELLTEFSMPWTDKDTIHPYVMFAEAMGFQRTSTEVVRLLNLPVADSVLDDLVRSSSHFRGDDYVLATYVDGVPEPLQDSLCAVMNLLVVDAPTGEVDWEADTLTPSRYREQLEVMAGQGRTLLTALAIHRESGRVAAYSDLKLFAPPNPLVMQDGTYVDRRHRGHRLGTAVKVENLRLLQETHPKRELVVTSNDDTNRWMGEINDALGFRAAELSPTYRRILE